MRFNIETAIRALLFSAKKKHLFQRTSIQALTSLALSDKNLKIRRISNYFLFQEEDSYC